MSGILARAHWNTKRKNELRSYTFNYSGNISASVSACDLMQFNVERSVMEDGDLAYL